MLERPKRRPKELEEKQLWVEANKEKVGGSLAKSRVMDIIARREAWSKVKRKLGPREPAGSIFRDP